MFQRAETGDFGGPKNEARTKREKSEISEALKNGIPWSGAGGIKCGIKPKISTVLRHKKGGDSMSRWRNNGGWNKSHGTVEKTPRIDSFEVKEVDGWGHLFGYADKGMRLMLDCSHDIEYAPDRDIESVELWHPKEGWSQIIEVSRKENGFGGYQTFFLCPACGQRARYLYQVGATFLCRKCSRLNYRSQQETRSDSMYYYHKGMDLVEKNLDAWPRMRPDGFSFCEWIPDRPRYMHRTTYRKYLSRFMRYRKKHSVRQMEDVARILRMFK